MERLEILPIILREMKSRRITSAELSRSLKINASSVNGLLKRNTIQVQKLAELSEIFQYNFFREIAVKFPYDQPNLSDQLGVTTLQNRIKELEMEVSILRQTIKDLAGR